MGRNFTSPLDAEIARLEWRDCSDLQAVPVPDTSNLGVPHAGRWVADFRAFDALMLSEARKWRAEHDVVDLAERLAEAKRTAPHCYWVIGQIEAELAAAQGDPRRLIAARHASAARFAGGQCRYEMIIAEWLKAHAELAGAEQAPQLLAAE